MKGTIEITVRTVPGGKVLTNVKGKECSEEDVLKVMTMGLRDGGKQPARCAAAAARTVLQRIWEDDGGHAAGSVERRGKGDAAV